MKKHDSLETLRESTGLDIRIEPDEFACDYTYQNDECFLGHVEDKQYSIGDKNWKAYEANPYIPFGEGPWNFHNTDFYELAAQVDTEAELREEWERTKSDGYEVFPVRLWGSRLVECDHDKAKGYVFVKLPYSNFMEKLAYTIAHPDAMTPHEQAKCVIEEWNHRLNGEVYTVTVYDDEEEIIECTCGIVGDSHALNVAHELASSISKGVTMRKFQLSFLTESLPFPDYQMPKEVQYPVPDRVGATAHRRERWLLSEGPLSDHHDIQSVTEVR